MLWDNLTSIFYFKILLHNFLTDHKIELLTKAITLMHIISFAETTQQCENPLLTSRGRFLVKNVDIFEKNMSKKKTRLKRLV